MIVYFVRIRSRYHRVYTYLLWDMFDQAIYYGKLHTMIIFEFNYYGDFFVNKWSKYPATIGVIIIVRKCLN